MLFQQQARELRHVTESAKGVRNYLFMFSIAVQFTCTDSNQPLSHPVSLCLLDSTQYDE